MMHIYISELGHISFRWWLGAWQVPSHYLNQCWNVVNGIFGNKLQWKFNWNSYIFIKENAFENVVWKMVAISSQPQCVKWQYILNSSSMQENIKVEIK